MEKFLRLLLYPIITQFPFFVVSSIFLFLFCGKENLQVLHGWMVSSEDYFVFRFAAGFLGYFFWAYIFTAIISAVSTSRRLSFSRSAPMTRGSRSFSTTTRSRPLTTKTCLSPLRFSTAAPTLSVFCQRGLTTGGMTATGGPPLTR